MRSRGFRQQHILEPYTVFLLEISRNPIKVYMFLGLISCNLIKARTLLTNSSADDLVFDGINLDDVCAERQGYFVS